jgi:3-hydroxybutyryl-CoA dehydrogenase
MLTVAVVGTGLMGRGIAAVAAGAGCAVALCDTDREALATAIGQVAGPRVRAGRDLADTVRGADLVVEAVAEDLKVKQALFAELDALAPAAVLATNTSVLQITRIAERAARPERIIGTHWWNPPGLIPIVEVVRGRHTSDDTMERTIAALTVMGKTPVRVEQDVPGFIGNRLQHALWREAIAMVDRGICTPETLDLVVRNTLGLRLGAMGPIENADYVGLDLTLAIHQAILPSLNRDTVPAGLLRDRVAAGDLGSKTGKGFLMWPKGSRVRAARRLAEHVACQLSASESR